MLAAQSEVMKQNAAPSPIDVAIIEDRREIRESLALLISGTHGFTCTGSYRSMEEALEKLHRRPDAALVDIGLPGMSGIDGIRLLRARYPDLLILMLTIYDDDERIFDAMCAGATGYLLKKTPPVQYPDDVARELTEAFIAGDPKGQRTLMGGFEPVVAKSIVR